MTTVSHGVNLAGIAVFERANFQIQQDMAPKEAVVKDQVHVVMFVAEGDAELAGLEAKAGAEFEQEFLEMVEQGRFEVVLRVVRQLGEAGEFENVRVADEVFDGFAGLLTVGPLDHGGFIFGKAGPLIEQGADLALELALGPVAFETFVLVEGALERVVNADEFEKVRPGEMKDGLGRQWRYAGRFANQWFANFVTTGYEIGGLPKRNPLTQFRQR